MKNEDVALNKVAGVIDLLQKSTFIRILELLPAADVPEFKRLYGECKAAESSRSEEGESTPAGETLMAFLHEKIPNFESEMEREKAQFMRGSGGEALAMTALPTNDVVSGEKV